MLIRSEAGAFPSPSETSRFAGTQNARAKDAENKGGVVVSEAISHRLIQMKQPFKIVPLVESNDPPLELERVVLSGSHCRYYKVLPQTLPITLSKATNVEIEVTVDRIGVFASTVTLIFRSSNDGADFRIARVLSVSVGDKDMDRLLAPTTPYVKRNFRVYIALPDEVYNPPKRQEAGGNPFLRLGHHPIPMEVKSMIRSQKYANTIVQPQHGSAEGMGSFGRTYFGR
jgi:hypothetical protein